jgi:hypothetical protein
MCEGCVGGVKKGGKTFNLRQKLDSLARNRQLREQTTANRDQSR